MRKKGSKEIKNQKLLCYVFGFKLRKTELVYLTKQSFLKERDRNICKLIRAYNEVGIIAGMRYARDGVRLLACLVVK